MAITKLTTITPTAPASTADYDAQNQHIAAFAIQMAERRLLLTNWQSTGLPAIAKGVYILHAGAVYLVDTADYAILTGDLSADGTYYIKLTASGSTLTAAWESSLTGFSWNAAYQGYYDSSGNQLIPYIVDYVSATPAYTKYRIYNMMSASADWITEKYDGTFRVVDISVSGTLSVNGAITGTSLDTGHGANELYGMDQDVKITSSPTFSNATIAGKVISTYLAYLNQAVLTTSSPTFVSVNTGHGANELYAMDQDVKTTNFPTFADVKATIKTVSAGATSIIFQELSEVIDSSNTVVSIVSRDIKVTITGNIRVYFDHRKVNISANHYVYIYKNGALYTSMNDDNTAYKTDYLDVSVTPGDTISVRLRSGDANNAYIKNIYWKISESISALSLLYAIGFTE